MQDAIDTGTAADLVRAAIIATAVASVGQAEDSKWNAITGLAFVRSKEAFIGVHIEGAKARGKVDIRADVMAAMVRSGRAIRKGEDIPPALIGGNDPTPIADYVKDTPARELRTEIRNMLGLADKVAGEVNKNHKQALATVLQAGTEDLGLQRYREHIAAHVGDTLAKLERRYAAEKQETETDPSWLGRIEKMTGEMGIKRRLLLAAQDYAVLSKDAMACSKAFATLLDDNDLQLLADQLSTSVLERMAEREQAQQQRDAATARLSSTVAQLRAA